SEQLEADERALPEDDLEHYTGQWVAVRDGTVVAHDADPAALQANPAVLPTDDVFPVGDPPSGFYTVSA
ncbi:MAG: hypothetical protein QOE10_2467, partial [Gaiellales bacterium]|nr:hypothetical protein [Gaiellales bacterium]